VYAAAGSLAADSQEAGSVITPLNILPGLGYMVGVIAFSAGADVVSRIMSLIPFWTPMLMPGRIASGTVETWELILATALMVGATWVTVRIGARVYLGGITQATRHVSWRQAFRGGKDLVST
jgi:ABC-2 type transport system permease protein